VSKRSIQNALAENAGNSRAPLHGLRSIRAVTLIALVGLVSRPMPEEGGEDQI
jgi:hypothetical protein